MRYAPTFLFLLVACSFTTCGPAPSEAEEQAINPTTDDPLPQYATETATIIDVDRPISITGRVVPMQEATIGSQVQGKVLPTDKLLQEGKYYRKGEVMVRIDNERLLFELRAQRSALITSLVSILSDLSIDYPAEHPEWEAFTKSIEAGQLLPQLPKTDNEQLNYFISARSIPNQYYTIKAREATLDDYVIRAPFSGRLTTANVEPGTIVSPGMTLATLSRTDIYELRAAIPADAVGQVEEGQRIEFHARNLDRTYVGTVNRFGVAIDETTQTVTVFVRMSGPQLREGLYLEGELPGRQLTEVVVLPKEALTRDNQVYLIENNTVASQPVEPVLIEADRVYLHGLLGGERVITESINGPIVGTKAR